MKDIEKLETVDEVLECWDALGELLDDDGMLRAESLNSLQQQVLGNLTASSWKSPSSALRYFLKASADEIAERMMDGWKLSRAECIQRLVELAVKDDDAVLAIEMCLIEQPIDILEAFVTAVRISWKRGRTALFERLLSLSEEYLQWEQYMSLQLEAYKLNPVTDHLSVIRSELDARMDAVQGVPLPNRIALLDPDVLEVFVSLYQVTQAAEDLDRARRFVSLGTGAGVHLALLSILAQRLNSFRIACEVLRLAEQVTAEDWSDDMRKGVATLLFHLYLSSDPTLPESIRCHDAADQDRDMFLRQLVARFPFLSEMKEGLKWDFDERVSFYSSFDEAHTKEN